MTQDDQPFCKAPAMTSTSIPRDPRFSKAARLRASFSSVVIMFTILFMSAITSFMVLLTTQLQRWNPDAIAVVPQTFLSAKLSTAWVALAVGVACCLLFTLIWKHFVGIPIGVSFVHGLLWFSIMVGTGAACQVIIQVLPGGMNPWWSVVSLTINALIFLQAFALLGVLAWLKKLAGAMA